MATEKRTIENDNLCLNVSAIVVDIEGTTTSINFVKETLFPYVREHVKDYIDSNWSTDELNNDITLLKEQASQDLKEKIEGAIEIPEGEGDDVKDLVVKNVLWQMDNDRKTKALKQLQGHIWKSGYAAGKLVGHIYEDVKDCLTTWVESGKKLYVYSSGSVEAQKLLFGSTKEGDLLSLFSGYFDTSVGAKTESASYTKIVDKLKEAGHASTGKDVLFLTDVSTEAKAAAEAGLKAVIVIREGNAPLPEDMKSEFPTIHSFCDLTFQGNAKRRKLSDVAEEVVKNGNVSSKDTDKSSSEKCDKMECDDIDTPEPSKVFENTEKSDKKDETALAKTEDVKVIDSANEKSIKPELNGEASSTEKKDCETTTKDTDEESKIVIDKKTEEGKNENSDARDDAKMDTDVISEEKSEKKEEDVTKIETTTESSAEKDEKPEPTSNDKITEKKLEVENNDVKSELLTKQEKTDDTEEALVEKSDVENVKAEQKPIATDTKTDNGEVAKEADVEAEKVETSKEVTSSTNTVEKPNEKQDDSKESNDSEVKTDKTSTNKDVKNVVAEIEKPKDIVKSNDVEANKEVKEKDVVKVEDDKRKEASAVTEVDPKTEIEDDKKTVESKQNGKELVTDKATKEETEIDVKKDAAAMANVDASKNGETDKKTDTSETKTNGTHEENGKNGIEKKENGVSEEGEKGNKVVKDKVVEKSAEKTTEANGVTNAQVV